MPDAWKLMPLLLLLLGACSSPPKPPTFDESTRRPANTAMAIELQVCQSDLHNTRVLAGETGRIAEARAAAVERMTARERLLVAASERAARQPAQPASAPPAAVAANGIFTIHFDFGSTRVVVPADAAAVLRREALGAPLVLLRGRTDGATDNAADSRIARERATAVRDYLVAGGVDPARIRATWQPVGDHAVDNTNDSGRSQNRRVEIELYRVLPVTLGPVVTGQP